MNWFDEAWLAGHQAKMAASRGETVSTAVPPDVIEFTIGHATILLNPLLRMHWAKRRRYQKALSQEIAGLTRDVERGEPFQRAIVAITRYSLRLPDADGLAGGIKPILDCLLVKSTRHPDGLGFCVDDGPAHMMIVPRAVRCWTRAEQRTDVRIECAR